MNHTEYKGWKNCLKLENGIVEVIIVADVGPRILSYRLIEGDNGDGQNVFKEYDAQAGGSGEGEWMIRGGHRLWVAPEQVPLTYQLDNEEVPHHPVGDSGFLFINPPAPDHPLRKEMLVQLSTDSSRCRVDHRIVNDGDTPVSVAPWALSVMKKGAVEIIPQPPLGEHPLDLLPDRRMILWPFTSLGDARFQAGTRYWILRQADHPRPFKLGLRLTTGWVGCAFGSTLFIKSVPHIPGAEYTDEGSNFETFTNADMLEIETLGEYVELEPGQSVEHSESWWLFDLGKPMPSDEAALREWLRPAIEKAGLPLH